MKARDAYVPFLLSKPLNKNEISELSWDINWKISNDDFLIIFYVGYIFQFISQDNSEISFLFSGLDNRNGTYASLAFISGVEKKNPSTGCGITSFWKSAFFGFFFARVYIYLQKQVPPHGFQWDPDPTFCQNLSPPHFPHWIMAERENEWELWNKFDLTSY